jgi:Family of unknown function (DUF6262)
MSPSTAQPRTAAALEARQARTAAMLGRVRDEVALLLRQKTPVTAAAVARRAGVSRTFLYENDDARALVASGSTHTHASRNEEGVPGREHGETAWRERALNAEDALKSAHGEIRSHRSRIAQLMGHMRDLETQWTDESIQRTAAENTILKQRVRELTKENRTISGRLQAARSNSRFQDRRLSQLEAELLDRNLGG